MKINFASNGLLLVDNARIIFRNFSGEASKYNRKGERNFALLIPDQDIADKLMNDVNEFGKGWNVKIKAPREEGDDPFMYLPIKVQFNDYGPKIYLRSGRSRVKVTEDIVSELDRISIDHVDLDIRPYDGETDAYGPFRAAYLSAMEVWQNIDRFEARYAEEEHPEE